MSDRDGSEPVGVMTIAAPAGLQSELARAAQRRNLSRSELCRRILREWLDAQATVVKQPGGE